MPVLPKDRRCLQSKAKAKPGERKTPVDAQEGGEKEEDWEIAEGKKKGGGERRRKRGGLHTLLLQIWTSRPIGGGGKGFTGSQ